MFPNTKQINKAIQQAFTRSKTLYLYKKQSKSNNEYEWSEEFQSQLLTFEKKFTKYFKLTDLETTKTLEKIFVNEKVNKNILIYKLIIEKLARINWEQLFTYQYIRVNYSKRLLC